MEDIRSARADTPADDEHDPEGSTLSGEWSAAVALRDASRAELTQISQAEERMTAGTYGICEVCGADIPLERLRVRPAATRCVSCAAL